MSLNQTNFTSFTNHTFDNDKNENKSNIIDPIEILLIFICVFFVCIIIGECVCKFQNESFVLCSIFSSMKEKFKIFCNMNTQINHNSYSTQLHKSKVNNDIFITKSSKVVFYIGDPNQCAICCEDIIDIYDILENENTENNGLKDIVETECGHLYHKECLQEWYNNGTNNSCPMCRKEINIKNHLIC